MANDELGERIHKFNSMSLPGQPMGMHMGTCYLVNDLWQELLRLRKIEAAARKLYNKMQEVYQDEAYKSVWELAQSHYGYYSGGDWIIEQHELEAALNESEPK